MTEEKPIVQWFALCWDGNPDALMYGDRLYFTRAFDIVSLKLFYNYGRLWWERYGSNTRLQNRQLHHDRDWLIGPDGYHCKLCGRLLREINPRLRKFCPDCEREFFNRYVQYDCWSWFRLKVFRRDKGHCGKCKKELVEYETWVCDHILPLCKGGKDWLEDPGMTNFQTLCVECNAVKTGWDLSSNRKTAPLAIGNPFNVAIGGFLVYRDHYGLLERFLPLNDDQPSLEAKA